MYTGYTLCKMNWLGMAHSYLSSVVSRGKEASFDALLTSGGILRQKVSEMRDALHHSEVDALVKL